MASFIPTTFEISRIRRRILSFFFFSHFMIVTSLFQLQFSWWRQQVPLKHWCTTWLLGATTQGTANFILVAVSTSEPREFVRSRMYFFPRGWELMFASIIYSLALCLDGLSVRLSINAFFFLEGYICSESCHINSIKTNIEVLERETQAYNTD
jgi:hypothetical protein